MTSIEPQSAKRFFEAEVQEPRKRFKATDLPLSSAQRAGIDGLLHTFKKSGEFDAIRKKLYSQFDGSEVKTTLTNALTRLAEAELERDPNLLSKDRRQAAPLIEGAVERSEIYRDVERDLDVFVEDYVKAAEVKMREIRRKDIGLNAADREEQLGSKTEEDYRNESHARRQAIAKRRQEEAEAERRRLAEEKRKLEEERRRQQEKEEREAREAQEEAAKKRLELEAERERLKLEKEEKDRQRAEYLELKKRQDAEWARERAQKEEEERRKHEKEREKEIEAVALEELIRECEQAAAKPKAKLERSISPRRKSTPLGSVSKESALASIMKAELRESEMAKAGKDDSKPAYAVSTNYARSSHRTGASNRESRSPSYVDSRRYDDRDERSRYTHRPSYDSRTRHEGYYESRSRYADERHTSRAYDDRDGYRRDDRDRRPRTRSRSTERRGYRDDPRSGTTSHRTYRERSRSRSAQRYRRKSRSRSPKDIDRYVPGSTSRSKHYDQRSSREEDSSRRESGRYDTSLKREESRDDRPTKGYIKREESRDDHSVKDYVRKEASREDRHERKYSSREDEHASSDRYYAGRGSGREREEDGSRSRRRSRSRSRDRRRESRRSRSRG